jgi:hypothetical protein
MYEPERLQLARPHLAAREVTLDQHNRKSYRDLSTGLQPTETRLVRGMDLRNPLLAISQRHRGAVDRPREDASYQSLQPTCCHEYPLEHATSKRRTLALPTAATRLALPPEPSPEFPKRDRPQRRRLTVAGVLDPGW